MDILPLFKSHYSIGRSILTLEDEHESEDYPDSIINLAKKNDLKDICLVEDNMSSFLQAYTNCKKYDINLQYGLRLTITDNMLQKEEATRSKSSKFIIFFKTEDGYRKLVKIYSHASKEGFYYEPRIDFNFLKNIWNSKDLLLCVPFYDSFIFNNTLKGHLCTPEISFANPIFFLEDNHLPFDAIVEKHVLNFTKDNSNDIIRAKTIYYKNRTDFKSYLTFRCINARTTLNKPELEHMTSDEFSLESYLNLNK